MKFKKTDVWGFNHALRGMRNPLESWGKSDSNYIDCGDEFTIYNIGENDLTLAKKLIKAGTEHRKFLRQIFVSVDITAPLYWWKEFDTYKIGTTANSTSTMHKISSKEINLNCFEIDDFSMECENLKVNVPYDDGSIFVSDAIERFILFLNGLREKYIQTKDNRYWKELIRWLPESWLQTRTVTMTYENVYNIYQQRKNHKLTEWSISFIDWGESLPYFKEFFLEVGDKNS